MEKPNNIFIKNSNKIWLAIIILFIFLITASGVYAWQYINIIPTNQIWNLSANKPAGEAVSADTGIVENNTRYYGKWFDIKYPNEFSANPTAPTDVYNGITHVQTDEARFKSPDSKVEFFIFSPLWAGDPIDYLKIPDSEIVLSDKSNESGNGLDKTITRQVTTKAKDGTYYRSFESIKEQVGSGSDLHHVFGIKYQDDEVYKKYRENYVAFKKSLRQYAD